MLPDDDAFPDGPSSGFSPRDEGVFLQRLPEFVLSLGRYFPADAVLFLEGISSQLEDFCARRLKGLLIPRVRHETLDPQERRGFLELSNANVVELAEFLRRPQDYVFARHLKVISRGAVLLYWAEFPWSMHSFLTGGVSAELAAQFCRDNDFDVF